MSKSISPFEKSAKIPKDDKTLLAQNEITEKKEAEQVIGKKKDEVKIDELPGVGATTAEKLKEAGYTTLMSLAVASPGELVEVCAIGDAVAKKIINNARNKLDMGFESGEDLLRKREQILKISTGSRALDNLFGGGIESGGITECYGQFGAGKSALAHQLAVNIQLPKEKGGADGMALWVDTENTFRPERINQIAVAQGLDATEVLKKIKVGRAFNSDHQTLMSEKIEELIRDQGLPIKLVIVDSLMSHFRVDFVGRGTLADRQQKINKHMHTLLKLASTYNIVIYVTNQVMSKPDTFFGDPTEAIGGNIVAHNSTTRVYLRKGKKGSRVAKMVDSPYLPESEAIFMITDKGIRDLE